MVVGKGGVGKTTVSAMIARSASRAGRRTLVLELDGKSGLSRAFDAKTPLEHHERVLLEPSRAEGGVSGQLITPDTALLEYMDEHGMRRLSKRMSRAGVVEIVSTAVPGLRELIVLSQIKKLVRESPADLIVFDAPAAGHAVSYLMSPSGMADAVGVGPIRSQAEQVLEMIQDHDNTKVVLVTLAENTPVAETIETAYALEDVVGAGLACCFVNGLIPLSGADNSLSDFDAELSAAQAADFVGAMVNEQKMSISVLAESLPLALFGIDLVPNSSLDLACLERLERSVRGLL